MIYSSPLFCALFFVHSLFAQTNGWYSAKGTSEKSSVITEPGFDENMYLLEGQDRALLIDAGFGMGNLRDFIRTPMAKPLIVVNTHAHLDHMFGDYQFPFLYIGEKDMEYADPYLYPNAAQQITHQMLHGITIAD